TQEPGRITITLAGVHLTPNGVEWLRINTLLKPVTILLIKRKDEDSVLGDIYVKRGRFFKYSLNREIVRMGLGRIPDLTDRNHLDLFQSNAAYSRLVHNLILCEKYADKRGVGMWKSSDSSMRLPSSLKESYERFYSFWFYATDTMRSGLIPQFFCAFGAFLQKFSRFTLNAIQIGSTRMRMGVVLKNPVMKAANYSQEQMLFMLSSQTMTVQKEDTLPHLTLLRRP
uniref:TNase-like domain-containing protein n=1 Tax=Romanomermis culicivorax TaxID=13658 RepID=A0A915LB59_ROMCU